MDDNERDACLTEIRIKIAHINTDLVWLKRLMVAAAILICGCLGIQLPDIFIHG